MVRRRERGKFNLTNVWSEPRPRYMPVLVKKGDSLLDIEQAFGQQGGRGNLASTTTTEYKRKRRGGRASLVGTSLV